MDTLVETTAPLPAVDAISAWLSTWPPLVEAIAQREECLYVTLDQFCIAAKITRGIAKAFVEDSGTWKGIELSLTTVSIYKQPIEMICFTFDYD